MPPSAVLLLLTAAYLELASALQLWGPPHPARRVRIASAPRHLPPVLQHSATQCDRISDADCDPHPARHVYAAASRRPPLRLRHSATTMQARDVVDAEGERDPYEVLDVQRGATLAEIRRAYRRRARVVHPDVPGGSDEDFRRLTRAFATVSDGKSRTVLDAAEMRRKARERASRSWDDARERAASSASGGYGDSRETGVRDRTGTRRESEEEAAAESERRRQRWREMAYDNVWREHMPMRTTASQEGRAAFAAAMEAAVQTFAAAQSKRAQSADLAAKLDEQEQLLTQISNREVILYS